MIPYNQKVAKGDKANHGWENIPIYIPNKNIWDVKIVQGQEEQATKSSDIN